MAEAVYYEGIEFPNLPYTSRWIEVKGSRMHYMEAGDPGGVPILLIHGNPTWSYLWRNVMPHLEERGRVIAVDLIGMGLSDKPDIGYTYFDHREYVWGFIEAMGLKNIVLVIHDWGSALGFDYAYHHQDNVRAIAFMEAHVATAAGYEGMPADIARFLKAVRAGDAVGEEMILNQNMFIEQILPNMVKRKLKKEELDAYRAPYPSPETRLPIMMWPTQLPIGGEPADVVQLIETYAAWLKAAEIPMLNLYATPGLGLPESAAKQLQSQYQKLEIVNVGDGLHFFQEDQPDTVGTSIANWLRRVIS